MIVLCVSPRVANSVLVVVALGAGEKSGWLVEVKAEARQLLGLCRAAQVGHVHQMLASRGLGIVGLQPQVIERFRGEESGENGG